MTGQPWRRVCIVHKHQVSVPIDNHHVWPMGEGGPDVPENIITVCANGHRKIHEYLRLLQKHAGTVPWLRRRMFGRKVRAWAEYGYQQIPRGEP